MKKTYIAPAMEEHTIAMSQMLCVSGELDSKQSITKSEDFGAREMTEYEW